MVKFVDGTGLPPQKRPRMKLPADPAIDKLVSALPNAEDEGRPVAMRPVFLSFVLPHEDFILDPVSVVAKIHDAMKRNDELQKNFAVDTAAWHHCETIDDRLHEALGLLGS
jgi:hypothetical protein